MREPEYFDWLCSIIHTEALDDMCYSDLLEQMFKAEFYSVIPMDENRASDGKTLRYRFIQEYSGEEPKMNEPCSILEMMVALALRIEEEYLHDSDYGDRTSIWFWDMVSSLGFENETNECIDLDFVDDVLESFCRREYASDGSGGLFTLPRINEDVADIEIWRQACIYMNEVLNSEQI